jgi:hypothetical protein
MAGVNSPHTLSQSKIGLDPRSRVITLAERRHFVMNSLRRFP